MNTPSSIFFPMIEALLTTPFKLHAQMPPNRLLAHLAGPVRTARAFDEFSQPLQGLSELIEQVEDPFRDDPTVETTGEVIYQTMDRLVTPMQALDRDLAGALQSAVQRWRKITKLSSSSPVRAQAFSDYPPPVPMHLSVPPTSRPPNLAAWPKEASQLTPQFLRDFINSFPYGMGIWELSKEAQVNVLMINPSLRKLSGYDESEMADISMNELFHPDDLDKFREIRRDVAQQGYGISKTLLRVIDAEHNVRWVDLCIAFLEKSSKGYFILVEQTERYLAQEENLLLRSAYNNAKQALSVCILPHNGPLRVVFNNLSFESALGYSPGEMKTRRLKLWHFFPKQTRVQTMQWLRDGIRKKELSGEGIPMLHKDGSVVLFDVEADISQTREELFAVVRFIESEHRVVVDRMRALATIVPGLAHDFNNALTVVMGEGALLRRALDTKRLDDEKLRTGLGVMIKGLRLLHEHIGRLDGLASSKGKEEDRSPADIEALIDRDLVQAAVGHDVAISFELVDDPWSVVGPLHHLWQALNNLVLNARDAMEAAFTKRLRIVTSKESLSEADLGALHVAARYPDVQPGDFMRISITDSGHGIPRSQLDQIFQPYRTTKQQQPSSVIMQRGHSGLGLWTTHWIIAERGGFIRVTSEEGEGATFDLYLPRTIATGHISRPPSSSRASAGLILTIGNAEHSRSYRGLQYALQSKSEEFEAVETLEEATELLANRSNIRAVVIDLPQSDKPSADMIAAIRTVRANLPIVVVAASDVDVREDDETCHVHIPFTPMAFMEKLKGIVKDPD